MRFAIPILALAVSITGCGAAPQPAPTTGGAGCISSFHAGRDYFPVKSTIKHAENFSLRYEKSYQVLTVGQPVPGGKPETYALVRCGAPTPELGGDLAAATVVQTPIRSLYSGSTTHLPLLVDLGRLDVLTGVSNASYVVNANVRARIEARKVVEYGQNSTLDTEKVIGALTALLCAVVSRTPSGVLPVNVITSLVGAPVVIAILLRARSLQGVAT